MKPTFQFSWSKKVYMSFPLVSLAAFCYLLSYFSTHLLHSYNPFYLIAGSVVITVALGGYIKNRNNRTAVKNHQDVYTALEDYIAENYPDAHLKLNHKIRLLKGRKASFLPHKKNLMIASNGTQAVLIRITEDHKNLTGYKTYPQYRASSTIKDK